MSHSEGHPERFSYMEKKEEGDRGVLGEIKKYQKGREQSSQ